ncbi:MAG: hypothetical protein LRY67_04740 [Gammaproteobacteria bacterium]|nr:hypothetical protein [Gammaproteobacteria bacterium]MCD8542490.1 hypothetical protein [Gammaproteobacteria bacterium]
MRLFALMLCLAPRILLAQHLVVTITPDYPLTPTNAKLICTSLHAQLPTSALNKLEPLKDVPFTCDMITSDGKQQLKITLNTIK